MTRKKKTIITVLAVVGIPLLTFAGFFVYFLMTFGDSFLRGPQYRLPIGSTHSVITEELAIPIAWQVMENKGYSAAEWQIERNDRKSNDNVVTYLRINGVNPQRGTAVFRKIGKPQSVLFAHMEIEGNTITCQLNAGK